MGSQQLGNTAQQSPALSHDVNGLSHRPPSGRDSSTHQDEETLVGKFLVLLDSGQHGQHQAGEHQQESAIAA